MTESVSRVRSQFATVEHAPLPAPLTQAAGRELIAVTVSYAPVKFTLPHRHGGDAFVYVLAGHIRSRIAGKPARIYGPGDHWFEPAGVQHQACGNASANKSAVMLVVFVAPRDAALTKFDAAPPQPVDPARTQSR